MKMDKKLFITQSQPSSEPSGTSSGINCDDGGTELPQNINQTDFQTIKVTNDTNKVSVLKNRDWPNKHCIIRITFFYFVFQNNQKMQLSQSDLLKLLSYLEGELQARDVVIAALKVCNEEQGLMINIFILFVYFFVTVGKNEKYY